MIKIPTPYLFNFLRRSGSKVHILPLLLDELFYSSWRLLAAILSSGILNLGLLLLAFEMKLDALLNDML